MDIGLPEAEWISKKPGARFVLIHGMTVTPAFWQSFAPSSLREATTAAYPLPGHFPWTLDDEQRMALNTEAIVNAYADAIERDFDGEPVMLVGHSTGAHICLLLAAQRPDLVSSVVLSGGFGCGRFEGRESVATRIAAMPVLGSAIFMKLFSWWVSSPENFRVGAARCVYDAQCPWESEKTLSSMELVRHQLLMSNPLDIAAMAVWLRQQMIMDQLSQIKQPVLNIVGLQDYVVPTEHQLRVSNLLPDVQTILLPNIGHLPMVEDYDQFNRAVSAFVELQALKALPKKRRLRPRLLAPEKAGKLKKNSAPPTAIMASDLASAAEMPPRV